MRFVALSGHYGHAVSVFLLHRGILGHSFRCGFRWLEPVTETTVAAPVARSEIVFVFSVEDFVFMLFAIAECNRSAPANRLALL